MDDIKISRFLSRVLRHRPEQIDLALDSNGWADVDELLEKTNAAQRWSLTRADIQRMVQNSDKQRFALSPDGQRIRANQGHSVDIDLGLQPVAPPEILFHGTARQNLSAIRQGGLQKMKRQHVHLSPDEETARRVGGRHGAVVILRVQAGKMHRSGRQFFCSANGVWLTDTVPAHFIEFPA